MKSQKGLRFRDLRGKTLAFKKMHCDDSLRFRGWLRWPGLAFRSFALKNQEVTNAHLSNVHFVLRDISALLDPSWGW